MFTSTLLFPFGFEVTVNFFSYVSTSPATTLISLVQVSLVKDRMVKRTIFMYWVGQKVPSVFK